MFYLNRNTALDTKLLHKMIDKFSVNVEPKLTRYKDYYDGLQAILNKSYADASKPCNKTVINFMKNICDSYAGYLATPGYISYNSKDDIEEIMDILRYNDYQAEDAALLLDALVYGTAAELMYIDTSGQTRFRLIKPTTCFGVYDDSLTGDLMYFVRMYKTNEWDENELYNVDVYSDYDVRHYTMTGKNGTLTFNGVEPHYFSQCPANIFYLPDEKSIFDCVISLQDSANELMSAEIDDYNAFCDAYLALYGVDANTEDIEAMKAHRVLLLPEGANAAWLTKDTNDSQIENMMKRIQDSIYRISSCVDFSSETLMSGAASGISIRYKMSGMETRAGIIEAEMKKALQRRIEIICGIASLKLGEEVFRDIDITFTRNIPSDMSQVIEMVNALKGTISDETLLAQLPFIDDPVMEIEKVNQQKQENMAMYGFGINNAEDDLDENE